MKRQRMKEIFELSNQIKSEDALYQAALLSSIDDALIATDRNLVITSWNKAAERIYNIRKEQAIGRRTTDLVDYEFFDTDRENAFEILQRNNAWKGMVKVTRTDGKSFILQASVTPVLNQEGEIIGYVSVNRDITDEIASKHSLQKLTFLLSSLEESFYIVDLDLRIIFINTKENIGRLRKYKIGDHALRYVPEHRKELVHEYYRRSFTGETISYEIFSAEPGEVPSWFHFTYIPLKDDFNRINNVCVVINNITPKKEFQLSEEKRKEAEKRLFESRKVFEDFMENSPLTAWITDNNGIIHYMNPPYLTFFGLSRHDIGKSLYDLFPADIAREYMANNRQVIDKNELIETIEKVRNFDGSISTYQVYKFPLQYKDSVMIAGWAVDITKQIRHQESLVELNRYKDKIVSVVTHDLKSYFTINFTTIEYLLADFENLSKDGILKYLQILDKNNSRTISFLDELTIWVKNALNRIIFNPVIIDLKSEIKAIVHFLSKQLNDKRISLKIFCGTEDKVYADLQMLRTVIRNLVLNAINFSPVESEIILKTALQDSFVVISVRDLGVGMPQTLVEKILTGSIYESSYGTGGEKGLGLGLSLAKDFIEKNGGKLQIESELKKGTTFYFTVPRAG